MTTAAQPLLNYKKIIISTVIKMFFVILVFFIINNWEHIKQSLSGNVPPIENWFKESFKPNNLIVMLVLTVYFFFRTYMLHKQLAKKRANYTEL